MLRLLVLGFLLIGSGILTTSCYVTSIHPITEQPSIEKRTELLGLWEGIPLENNDEQKKSYLFIMKAKEGQVHLVVMEDDYEYSESYTGFISVVNNHMFLNVKALREDSKQQGFIKEKAYTLLYVECTKKTLSMTLLNEDLMKELLAKKKLKGSVLNYHVQLTDDSKNIEAFIKQTKLERLLDKKMLYKARKVKALPKKPR